MKYLSKCLCIFYFLALSSSALDQKRPNILFAIADDMSHTSAYGYKFLKTPNFDSIAKRGILFHKAFTPSSKCSPSRSVIITGRNPWQLEAAGNHWPTFPNKFKSVVESLGDLGYFTGYTGKGWGPGNSQGRQLTGPSFNKYTVKERPASGINKIDYAANFEDFITQKPKDKPFFFWYGCKEPHRGYEFKSGVKNGKTFSDLDFAPSFWGQSDDVKHDILDYALEVEYYDQHLGRILKKLEEIGELENTLIIATSDNSMPFPRFKGHPYLQSCNIPFTVMWPGKIKNPGRESRDYISFIDLAPTFLEVAGFTHEQSGMKTFQGRSLFDVFNNERPKERQRVFTGRERNDLGRPNDGSYPVRSLIKGKYVYMHNFEPDRWPCADPETGYRDTDGSPTKTFTLKQGPGSLEYDKCYAKRPQEELFDLTKDPESIHNLAANPEYEAVKQVMKKELFDELKKQGDPRMFGKGHLYDEYIYYRGGKNKKKKTKK